MLGGGPVHHHTQEGDGDEGEHEVRVEGELLVERIREENEGLVVRDRDLRRAYADHTQDVENGWGVACDEGEGSEVLQEHHTADGDDQVVGDVAPGVGGTEHVQLKVRG